MNTLERMHRILLDARDLLHDGERRRHPDLEARMHEVLHGMEEPTEPQDHEAVSHREPPVEFHESQEMAVDRQYAGLSQEERQERLHTLAGRVQQCDQCPLSYGRTHAVPGGGVLDPLVMFVGEAPGRDEDRTGRPFVGAAGQYLDKWIVAMGLDRDTQTYITNIVKCRPPDNRDPRPEESDACTPYLVEQILLVRPRIIVTLGRVSMRILTGTSKGITRVHGTFFSWHGIPVVPTFHPSAVLRNAEWRRPVWEDLKAVRNWLVDHCGHTPGDT